MMCLHEIAKFVCARVGGLMLLSALVWACTETKGLEFSTEKVKSVGLRLEDVSAASAETNLVINGSFDGVTDPWWVNGIIPNSLSIETGELCVGVPAGTVNMWDVMVGQSDIPLEEGTGYEFQFTARASDVVGIKALVGEPDGAYTEFSTIQAALDTEPQTFSQQFQMRASDYAPQVGFQIGGADFDWTFCIDDVSVVPLVRENLTNGSFDNGLTGWWTDTYITEWDVSSGAFCADIPSTAETWEGLLGQNNIDIEAGVAYTISFFVQGDPQQVLAVVQNSTNYSQIGALAVTATPEGGTYSTTFTAAESVPDAQFMFQLGGADAAWNVCIDDVSLLGGAAVPVYEPDTGPRVRVNQVAYLPFGPKLATLVTEAASPLSFELRNAAGTVVFTGESVPYGIDASSQLNVHTMDFTAFTKEGEGYTLVADGETSHPFAVGTAGYESLRVDALSFYYPMRSGTAIDGAVAGEGYARPAGHVSSPADGAANQGDLDVPCQPTEDSELYYGEPWTCDYTLDVVGGWYDAGDQGKYVVNGGITVFQLLNAFERTKAAPSTDLGALSDGSLRIPETGNGVPDILDEARYELEFFLTMMVPEGEPSAGMVHHKIHDNQWTGLPTMPHEDSSPRWLHRPSTAATLNLAAAAAQGARVFAPYDAAFASSLLTAARTAWAAALATPDLYAPGADGSDGGGAYADNDVSDEFYWAAAELYLTTGEQAFLDYVLGSDLHTADVFTPDGIIWNSVAGLARMDLAAIPSAIPDRAAVIDSVIQGAMGYLNDQAANGFGQPYQPTNGSYVWGSNSQVLNNLIVLATAYDLSGDEVFRQGALKGFDYILGRNALNISYVTDYGTVFSRNMHSRWYANQIDPSLPHPPSGTVSGGPNSQLTTWDPIIIGLYGAQGCAPQFCYVDDINSWSTNELAINWNAALAWLASFIADQDTAESGPYGDCRVSYRVLHECPKSGEFQAVVSLTNSGNKTLNVGELSWSFFGDQSVRKAWGGTMNQDGATVTLAPNHQKKLKPGRTLTYMLSGNRGDLAVPNPGTFFLNGRACQTK